DKRPSSPSARYPTRAKNLAARQSGSNAESDGRRTPPASTRSVTELARRRSRPLAAAPSRHQACGTSATVSCSASPSSASTKTGRPAIRQFSTRRRGSAPLPAIMPSGPGLTRLALSAIRSFRLTDRAGRVGAEEGDNIVDRPNPAKALRHFVDPVVERAVRGEQELIGAAQRLDVVAAEAAALHADDVDSREAGPVAHDLAIRDHVSLNA